jgi:hypothetical protein
VTIYSKDFAVCPHCNIHTNETVSHLYGDRLPFKFGPWYCDACGGAYEGTVLAPGNVEIRIIDRNKQSKGRRMALLKLAADNRTVWFVIDGIYINHGSDDRGSQDRDRYFYEEHSCPTNWLRDVAAVIEDNDSDPHGFLEFVRSVEVPSNFNESDWEMMFPEAFGGPIIDGAVINLIGKYDG